MKNQSAYKTSKGSHRGNITVEQAIEIFESARQTIIEKWKKGEKRGKDKHKL